MKFACCSTYQNLKPETGLRILREVYDDLNNINTELYAPGCTKTKCKHQLIALKCVDRRLRAILCSCEPSHGTDDLESNFGLNMKLELKEKERAEVRKRLELLKTEWHMQVQHMNRLSKELTDAEKELELQSAYCTHQGLILSRLLWKVLKLGDLVEFVTANCEEHLVELIRVVDGCIYGFIKTYRDEMPSSEAEEYQYVLSLCGLLTNLSSAPDGRHFLMNKDVTVDLYNLIIEFLPEIPSDTAEDLKWLMLVSIYNLMVNPLGLKYTRNQMDLPDAISKCLSKSSSSRIITITLAIIKYSVEDINTSQYCQHLFESLPIQHIIDLSKVKDFSISKAAKIILTKLGKAFELFKDDLTVTVARSVSSIRGKDSVQKVARKVSSQKIKKKVSRQKIGKKGSSQKIKRKKAGKKPKRKQSTSKVDQKDSEDSRRKVTSEESASSVKETKSREKIKKKASKEKIGKKQIRSKKRSKTPSDTSASGDSSKSNVKPERETPSKTTTEEDSKSSVKRNLSWPVLSQCIFCQEMQQLKAATKSYSCTADFSGSASTKTSNFTRDNSTNTAVKDDVRTTMPPNSKFALKSFNTKIKLSSVSAPINLKLRKEVHINDSDKLNALHTQEPCTNINEKLAECPTQCANSTSEKSEEKQKLSVTTIFKIPTNKDLSRDVSERDEACTCASNSTQNNDLNEKDISKKSKEKSKLSVTAIFKAPMNRDLSGTASEKNEGCTCMSNSTQNKDEKDVIVGTNDSPVFF